MNNRFVHQALLSFKIQYSEIINSFFADANISYIQKALSTRVKRTTGYVIGQQPREEIYTIMFEVYSMYSQNVTEPKMITKMIQFLNDKVLERLVPLVSTNAKQYLQYIHDINNQPTPISYGQSTSSKGLNSLEYQNPF